MAKTKVITLVAVSAVTLAASIMIFSCKGRTMNNVEPGGDTIEVEINQQPAVNPVDTIEIPDTVEGTMIINEVAV